MMRRRHRFALLVSVTLFMTALGLLPHMTPQAQAGTSPTMTPSVAPTDSGQVLVVNSLDDDFSNPPVKMPCDSSKCTLRSAIDNATWGSTINFAPGLSGTITLGGDLDITGKLTIN